MAREWGNSPTNENREWDEARERRVSDLKESGRKNRRLSYVIFFCSKVTSGVCAHTYALTVILFLTKEVQVYCFTFYGNA